MENERENIEALLNSLKQSIFPNFRSTTEIFNKSIYQGILLSENEPELNTRGGGRAPDGTSKVYMVFRIKEFGSRYQTVLRGTIKSGFTCNTFRLYKKFKIMFEKSFLFDPSSNHPTDELLMDIETFSYSLSKLTHL